MSVEFTIDNFRLGKFGIEFVEDADLLRKIISKAVPGDHAKPMGGKGSIYRITGQGEERLRWRSVGATPASVCSERDVLFNSVEKKDVISINLHDCGNKLTEKEIFYKYCLKCSTDID